MENIIINFEVDNKDLLTTIDLLQKTGQITQQDADKFRTLGQQSAQAVKSIQTPLTQVNKDLKEVQQNVAKGFVLDKSNSVAKTASSFTSLRAEIKKATADAIELSRKFGELSPQAVEAQKKVAKLKDEFGDMQKRIDALDPDAKFRGLSQTISGLAGAFGAITGAVQLFGGESKQAQEIAQKFQGALNIVQGLNSLGQLKDALGGVRAALGLTTVATVAQTTATEGMAVATTADAVATEGATVATKGFTAALLTNPITIAVAAVAALAAAFLLAGDNAEDATESVDKLFSKVNDANEKLVLGQKKSTQELQNRIALLKAQGKTEQEIKDIEVSAEELRRKNAAESFSQRQKNIDALVKEQKELIRLAGLGEIDSAKRDAEIKRIDEKIKAEKDAADELVLITLDSTDKIRILNAQLQTDITKKKKEESKKRQKEDEDEWNRQIDLMIDAFNREYNATKSFIDKSKALEISNELDPEVKLKKERDAKIKEIELAFEATDKGTEAYKALINAKNSINAKYQSDWEDLIIQQGNAEINKEKEVAKEKEKIRADELKKTLETIEQISAAGAAINDIFSQIYKAQSTDIENRKNAVLEADQAEIDSLKEKYDKGLINKRTYEQQLKALEDKKKADEKKYAEEEKKLKNEQAKQEKAFAIFQATINLALAVSKAIASANPFLAILAASLAGAQLAAVIATPVPKFHKGRLAQGNGMEEMAIIRKDETIFNPQQSKEYAPTFSAIYHGKIKPGIINDYVNLTLKGKTNTGLDTSKLAYDIAYALRDQNKVIVKNMPDLAKAIADNLPKPDPRKW